MRFSGCPAGHGMFCLASTALISRMVEGIKGLGSLSPAPCHLQWWNFSSHIALLSILQEWEDTASSFTVYVPLGPKPPLLRMLFKGFWVVNSLHRLIHPSFGHGCSWDLFEVAPRCLKPIKMAETLKPHRYFFLDCFMLFPQWQSSSFLTTSVQILHSQRKRNSKMVICQVWMLLWFQLCSLSNTSQQPEGKCPDTQFSITDDIMSDLDLIILLDKD